MSKKVKRKRGRPSLAESERKKILISMYVDEKEKVMLEVAAGEAGLSVSKFLRKACEKWLPAEKEGEHGEERSEVQGNREGSASAATVNPAEYGHASMGDADPV